MDRKERKEWWAILIVLLVVLVCPVAAEEPEEEEEPQLTKEEVAALSKEFKDAMREGPDGVRIEAIEKLSEYKDATLARAVTAGLGSKNPLLRTATAGALGKMGQPEAVPALGNALKPNREELETYLAILAAMGEIGHASAIPHIASNWWSPREPRAVRAKIAALGNIRDKKSVDELLDLIVMTNRGAAMYARDIRQALCRLTGEDFGMDAKAWKDWWKENRKTFVFPEKPKEDERRRGDRREGRDGPGGGHGGGGDQGGGEDQGGGDDGSQEE